MKFTHLKDVHKIDRNEFLNFSNNQKIEIKSSILNGSVFIIKNAVDRTTIRSISSKIINKNKLPISDSTMLEGIKNIYYVSEPKGGSYVALDQSWYFFPWNLDKTGLTNLLQDIFDQVITMNGHDPSLIKLNTPKDIIIQRFHLIFYPEGNGKISKHIDPINIININSGVYITEYGTDYNSGGFYVYNKNNEKIYLDKEVKSGDMILFYNNLAHGVDPVICNEANDMFKGRCFINMSLIESHEQDKSIRNTAIGIS